jgi:hypothetical protein
MIDYFSGGRKLIIDGFDDHILGLRQNIGIESKAFERVLKDPMKPCWKIGKSKITCRFDFRTFKLYGKQMLRKWENHVSRRLIVSQTSKSGLREISKMIKRGIQSAGVRGGILKPKRREPIC